jgi:hypothetical protein
VPATATFYDWVDGALEGEGAAFSVVDADFSRAAPPSSMFRAPRHASKDTTK